MIHNLFSTILVLLLATAAAGHAEPPTREELNARIEQNGKDVKENKKLAAKGINKDLVQAVSEPGMDQPEIPRDEKLFAPFKTKPGTAEEAEMRQRLLNALWNTPLGQMFYYYLFSDHKPVEVPSISRQFVHRIFSDSGHAGIRMAAIYILVGDLYAREKMTPNAVQRLVLLQGDFFQQNETGNATTKSRAVFVGIFFLVLAFPFGYPAFRDGTRQILEVSYNTLFRRSTSEPVKKIRWSEILSPRSLKKYEPLIAAQFFFSTFGPFSMTYFFYIEWLSAAIGQNVSDTTMMSGLEEIIKAIQL